MKNIIYDIQLVITVALKKEIPKDWLTSHNVPVHTLNALKTSGLSRLNNSHLGILVVITGAGLRASEEAAHWIQDNLKPLFVVNIGTCGLINRKYSLGKWFSPQFVSNEEGQLLELDSRLPIPYADNTTNIHSLLSVNKTNINNLPESWRKHDAIDMECYSQAKVFRKTNISFHCLKFSSDYSDGNAILDFNVNLGLFSQSLKKFFCFLDEDKMKVTVIVPVYNREHTIKRAIDSLLYQSCPPEEIIIVDDGSNDRTVEILKSYEEKITCVFLPKNSGPSAARNEGIRHVHTEWLAFLDSDDCWKKDKLKNQLEYLRKYPFYNIIQSEEMWIRNGMRVNPRKYHKKPVGWIWEPSLQRCLISPSGVLVKKALLEKYGYFDENLPACEDYDLWLKIARYHPVGLEPSLSVVKYGGHKDQLSKKYPVMDKFRIKSLHRLLKNESLPHFREKITIVLSKKLKILIKGYEKRQKTKEAQECRKILKSLSKYQEVTFIV